MAAQERALGIASGYGGVSAAGSTPACPPWCAATKRCDHPRERGQVHFREELDGPTPKRTRALHRWRRWSHDPDPPRPTHERGHGYRGAGTGPTVIRGSVDAGGVARGGADGAAAVRAQRAPARSRRPGGGVIEVGATLFGALPCGAAYLVVGGCLRERLLAPGDSLIIDTHTTAPRDGEVVVARVNGVGTAKLFYRAGAVELRPASLGFTTIIARPSENWRSWGAAWGWCARRSIGEGA